MFFKNNGSHRWVLLFLPYVWVLIELEAPDVDTKMKTESLVDSRVRGCGARKGDELILGRQGAESSASSAGLGSAVCLSPSSGREPRLTLGGEMNCLRWSVSLLTVSRWLGPWWPLRILFIHFS